MKFRYKILILNLIILSVGTAIVGYFMIKKNYEMVLDNQIKNAIEENNMLQASIEYKLLDIIGNPNPDLAASLYSISKETCDSLGITSENIQILLDSNVIFPKPSDNIVKEYTSQSLDKFTTIGKKYYFMSEQSNERFIYVVANNLLLDSSYTIINRNNITDIFNMVRDEQQYFSYLLLITIFICSAIIFIISALLTKPLEKLSKTSESFGKGDYTVRSDVSTNDEIGDLSDTYNKMSDAIENHMNELLDMISRRDQFVADFTHELKTPMTSIIGYSDMLRSKELSRENQILSASYIFNEGKRLEAMSMKLFDFIYTKNHDIEFKDFSTLTLLERIKNSVAPALLEKEIILTCDVENIKLSGDIELLTSAFINLIDNARKASNKGGEIKLFSISDDKCYRLIVQDFGIGIAKEHLDKICNEFYMTDKARSRKEGGAGLGLSLAAMIIKAHNARLTIESELEKGTAITVEFNQK